MYLPKFSHYRPIRISIKASCVQLFHCTFHFLQPSSFRLFIARSLLSSAGDRSTIVLVLVLDSHSVAVPGAWGQPGRPALCAEQPRRAGAAVLVGASAWRAPAAHEQRLYALACAGSCGACGAGALVGLRGREEGPLGAHLGGGGSLLSQLWQASDMRLRLLQFEDKEKITLWYNKVGPYNNPQETYQYFDLPFCRPEGATAPACCALR
jgi:hypothetical protein